MAVPASPVAAASLKRKKKTNNEEAGKKMEPQVQGEEVQKQPKRTKSPGLRVVGGRIYDSENGKTCHQCRQKTMDFTAGCKKMKGDKQCTIKFCHKCLLNRYGEKAEDMAALDDWNCPRCRDICNCSFCRKKKGHKPTGILAHTAKATGFSSVSELLHVKGHDVYKELYVKSKAASPKKSTALIEVDVIKYDIEPAVVSPKKQGKENSLDQSCNGNLNAQLPPSSPKRKKAKKVKRDLVVGLTGSVEVPKDNGAVCTPKKVIGEISFRRSPRKFNIPHEVTKKEEIDNNKDNVNVKRSPKKSNAPQKVVKTDEKTNGKNCGNVAKKEKKTKIAKVKPCKIQKDPIHTNIVHIVKPCKIQKDTIHTNIVHIVPEVVLPPGSKLTNVAGIDLLPDEAGYALQFLEFCSVFGQVLAIRKGQPESVLRDMVGGRSQRRGKCSSAVQFIIQLVSFILKDSDEEQDEEEDDESVRPGPHYGKDSWIYSLRRCLAESLLELEDVPEKCFDKGIEGYEMLQSTQKLKLLTFLCDESLSTKEMRTWIDEQNLKYVEETKEAKESLNAAKEKEKQTKRKLQEEVAKAVLAKKGIPLTISEHDSIISKIKKETDRARTELLEAIDLMPKKKRRSDAVRTEPDFLDDKGRAYWRLTCYSDSDLLLQELGSPEHVDYKDKWFSYNVEELQVVEKYISSVSLDRHKRIKLADKTKMKSDLNLAIDSSSNDVLQLATVNV